MPDSGAPLLGAGALPASQPMGVASYCATPSAPAAQPFWEAFCHADASPTTVALTPERWKDLQTAQAEVDASISYGPTLSWDPLLPVGDCKTYSARTALALLDRGWPASALRIATALVDDGSRQQWESHAVLLVDTDRGTIVLDSRQLAPRPWQDLSYVWLSAEVPGGHGAWSLLSSDGPGLRTALLASLSAARGREQIASAPMQ